MPEKTRGYDYFRVDYLILLADIFWYQCHFEPGEKFFPETLQ